MEGMEKDELGQIFINGRPNCSTVEGSRVRILDSTIIGTEDEVDCHPENDLGYG